MDLLPFVVRIALAQMFAVAGFTKLLDCPHTEKAVEILRGLSMNCRATSGL